MPDDRLGHAEQDVRAHDVDDVIEHGRPVDEVDEALVIGQELAPIHEAVGVEVRGMVHPAVVADGQFRPAIRLVAGQLPEAVHLVAVEVDLVRVEHLLEVQVAIHPPLPALFGTQCLHGASFRVPSELSDRRTPGRCVGAVQGRPSEKRGRRYQDRTPGRVQGPRHDPPSLRDGRTSPPGTPAASPAQGVRLRQPRAGSSRDPWRKPCA